MEILLKISSTYICTAIFFHVWKYDDIERWTQFKIACSDSNDDDLFFANVLVVQPADQDIHVQHHCDLAVNTTVLRRVPDAWGKKHIASLRQRGNGISIRRCGRQHSCTKKARSDFHQGWAAGADIGLPTNAGKVLRRSQKYDYTQSQGPAVKAVLECVYCIVLVFTGWYIAVGTEMLVVQDFQSIDVIVEQRDVSMYACCSLGLQPTASG